MNITLIGTETRVPRDHAAAAAAVDFLKRLEAHKLDGTQILRDRRFDEEVQACPTPFRLM